MATTWEAKGSYVFEGSDCIAICDTDNADAATYERRAKIMAAGLDLLIYSQLYMATVKQMNDAMKDGLNVQGAVSELVGAEDMLREAISKATGV